MTRKTVLSFNKRFVNEKEEIIFQLSSITNLFIPDEKKYVWRYDGDILVNLTTKQYYIPSKILTALSSNHSVEMEPGANNNPEETLRKLKKRTEEMAIQEIFEMCEELERVIG